MVDIPLLRKRAAELAAGTLSRDVGAICLNAALDEVEEARAENERLGGLRDACDLSGVTVTEGVFNCARFWPFVCPVCKARVKFGAADFLRFKVNQHCYGVCWNGPCDRFEDREPDGVNRVSVSVFMDCVNGLHLMLHLSQDGPDDTDGLVIRLTHYPPEEAGEDE